MTPYNPVRIYRGETFEVVWDGWRDKLRECPSLVGGGQSSCHPDVTLSYSLEAGPWSDENRLKQAAE